MMWSNVVESNIDTKVNKNEIEKKNMEQKKLSESAKPSGVGIDVTDWATDDNYFTRTFKKWANDQTRADGTEGPEKIL